MTVPDKLGPWKIGPLAFLQGKLLIQGCQLEQTRPQYYYANPTTKILQCQSILGPRGPLGTPSLVRPLARPRQKSKSHQKPCRSSQAHVRPLI